ncbi:late competence development ComFB family protein [Thalassolituus sp. LLYu03]|uniref:late competence development ComFB family protein n=1 Tax=Thalassolituus sp. LLYu03 TaxID=3421656 RepID=UPI003D2E44DF
MSISNHIRNYFEQLVAEEILRTVAGRNPPAHVDYMADVACVALNRLPARYIRYEVDMAFYMTPDELISTHKAVTDAVRDALVFVDTHKRDD